MLKFVIDTKKNLCDLRSKIKLMHKSKNRNEKLEQDLLKQIDKDHNLCLTLNDHKQEIIKEINYLCEFHLKKLNEFIENSEKNIQANLAFQQGPQLVDYDYKIEKVTNILGDDISLAGSSKLKFIIN